MSALRDQGLAVSEIARIVGGKILKNDQNTVYDICALNQPKIGAIAFSNKPVCGDGMKTLVDSGVQALLSHEESLRPFLDCNKTSLSLIAVSQPYEAILKLASHFRSQDNPKQELSDLAFIDPTAKIGAGVTILPFCFVAANVTIEDSAILHSHVSIYPGAKIGEGSILHAGAVVRENCIIGKNSVIQNGAVVGADGFGYLPGQNGQLLSIPQVGIVETGDNVDIGANTCIDRATLGTTSIGKNSKIDNLVQLGHNVEIGQSSILCGQSGVAGSTKIGNGVVIGGAVGVADHLSIADGTRFAGGSVVLRNIKEKGDYAGHPALPSIKWKRQQVLLDSLPKLFKSIKELLKKN